MSRFQILVLVACVLTATSGCRNRCNNTCGNGLFTGSSTIAAPPTYSLNIPSVARNQPYYVPGTNTVAPVNPNTTSPTPTISPSSPNSLAPNTGSGSGANGASNSGSNGQPVASTPTTFVETSPSYPVNYQTAASSGLPGTGLSYTDSTNYRTTQVDETRDGTRLPATDASNVRAPASSFPAGNVNSIAQLPQSTAPSYPATFNSTVSATQPYQNAPTGFAYNNGQPAYPGTPVVSGNNGTPTATVYAGQPNGQPVYYGAPPTGSQPTVLAQSTASYDASSGSQIGWQDRDLNTSTQSSNR